MTANLIAQVVENYYNKLDLDKMAEPLQGIEKYNSYGGMSDDWINTRITDKTYFRWCQAIGVLESYCRQNLDTFQPTELVEKWAPKACEERYYRFNEWRIFGGYNSFSNYLAKKRYD